MSCPYHGFDISANVKVAFDLHTQRIASLHKVFENDVDYVLVENLHVSKRVDIELQTLELNAKLVGNVFDSDSGEIRKVRERADGRELGDFEADPYFASGKFVGESSERR